MTAPILLDSPEELARWLRVSPRTIRMWARRGHVTRYPGDLYSGVEVADYLDNRDNRMVKLRTLRDKRGRVV